MKALGLFSKAFIACATLALGLAAGPAFAHAKLLAETPPANESSTATPSTTPPGELRLSFSEELVAAFSRVEVLDENGQHVAATVTLDPTDAKVLVATFSEPLPAGSFTINWKAVSADGHKITGTYTITVGK